MFCQIQELVQVYGCTTFSPVRSSIFHRIANGLPELLCHASNTCSTFELTSYTHPQYNSQSLPFHRTACMLGYGKPFVAIFNQSQILLFNQNFNLQRRTFNKIIQHSTKKIQHSTILAGFVHFELMVLHVRDE